mgnify:CR=1 FL=1
MELLIKGTILKSHTKCLYNASNNSDYQPHKINEALSGDYKKYLEFFEGTDYEIGISTSKDGALPGGSTISCISGTSQIRKPSLTKSVTDELPPIKSFVDGIEISTQNISRMILGNDIPDTHVCRVVKFPDTGEAQLPETIFDGIPDTAYCDMLILRGNVENIEQDQYTYKLVGKTHQQISFILIREISK